MGVEVIVKKKPIIHNKLLIEKGVWHVLYYMSFQGIHSVSPKLNYLMTFLVMTKLNLMLLLMIFDCLDIFPDPI